MKRNGLLALLGVMFVSASAIAQEPVVPAADSEALFTDADPKLHANKQVVLHILRELLQCNYWEQADKYLTERYLQGHGDALTAAIARGRAPSRMGESVA